MAETETKPEAETVTPDTTVPQPNPVGRPSKYNDTMPERVSLFIAKRIMENCLPTHAGLATYIGVGKTTIERWATAHPEFRVSLDILNAVQEDMLIQRGLKSEYNSTITKLMLSSNHGYKERLDGTSGDKPIAPQIVDFSTVMAHIKEQEEAEAGGDKSA